MTMTDDRPRLKTPTGGAESQPERPQDWHGHPFVWAWNACLGATSRTFIEGECLAADLGQAPQDAVYKDGDEWISVGMIARAEWRQRVREYGQALIKWEKTLTAHRQRPMVVPHQQVQPAPVVPAEGRGATLLKRQPPK
ncbi:MULTISPECIES: hypothetical protein [unclassified Streptomyces]|uniref:hypothetical protein n=1 Tax=unclassified Streptomyces TaxID=2593676 RepID=UPI003D91B970